jgi:hypothetical protein
MKKSISEFLDQVYKNNFPSTSNGREPGGLSGTSGGGQPEPWYNKFYKKRIKNIKK